MASEIEFVNYKDFVESLPARTAAKSGDKSIVSNSTDGPGSETNAAQAQKVLAGNVAKDFDPTRTSDNPYKAGESVAYDGKIYTFKVDHYGAWVAADVEGIFVFGEIDKLNFANRLGLTYSVSNSKYHSQTLFYGLKAGDVVSVYVGDSTEEGYSNAAVYYYVDSAHSLGVVKKGKYATFTIPADCVRVTIQFNYVANTTSSHTIFFGLLTAGSATYDLDDYIKSKNYKKIGALGIAESLLLKNGNAVSTNLWEVGEFVALPFNTGSKFFVKSSVYQYGAICFYDENKNLLYSFDGKGASDEGYTQDINPIEREFTMGATWKYVRYCVCKQNSFVITDCYVSSRSCGWKEMGQRFIDELASIQDKVKFVKTLAEKKVLIIGDSISTYDYGTYKKWNDVLKDQGFFGEDYVNSSQHATGFVANRVGGSTCGARLKAIQNPETFDYVIIFCGINDFIQSIPWGTAGGDADTDFIPAVDDFFDYLVKKFINARIVVLSPLRTYNRYPNQVGKTQDEYAEVIRNKAEYYSLPVLNLTEHSGFCPYVTEFKNAWTLVPQGYEVHDGVHPIYEYGRDFLAPMIAKFLQEFV